MTLSDLKSKYQNHKHWVKYYSLQAAGSKDEGYQQFCIDRINEEIDKMVGTKLDIEVAECYAGIIRKGKK